MKKVLILFGGNSYEHEISCNSVNFIIKNIDTDLFDYKIAGIDYDNIWYEVEKNKPVDIDWQEKSIRRINNINEFLKDFDIVFPMIHGSTGEDGKIQSFLELNNIKFVGCDSFSSIICYDKLLTKLILEKYNILQIPYIIYDKNIDLDSLDYPVIVKPSKCGSSIGISVVYKKKKIKKAIKSALKYDNTIIIEKYITHNRELECAILEKRNKLLVSDIGEIINNGSWYDYNSKYKSKSDTIISDIDINIKKDIQEISKKVFKILNCKSLSRVDFLFDLDTNKLYFNEINTIPGFTEISMYPKLIMNEGISAKDLISSLVNL